MKFSPIPFAILIWICLYNPIIVHGQRAEHGWLNKKVVPYPYIRESDVLWSRRVWQVIDLREKINLPLNYPLEEVNGLRSLFDIIKQGILDGSLTAYSTGVTGQEDDFRTALELSEVKEIIMNTDTLYTRDPDSQETVKVIQDSEIRTQHISRYKIKEDWFFDKQRSERYIRIIGIAPQKEKFDEGVSTGAYETLFWLYFPECRYVFIRHGVFNSKNDAAQMSFDDLFIKRMFSGYIVKESNVYNRDIIMVLQGLDALMKAEEIKERLFIIEHDL